MSKKMKRVALVSSPYGIYEDAKTMFKHRTLMQDYQDLQKEAEVMSNKLETTRQRKLTLLAEVRFLRLRYKHLLKNKSSNPPQEREHVRPQNLETQRKKNMKIHSKKEASLHNLPPIFYLNPKGLGKDAAARNVSSIFDLKHKETLHSGKEAALHYPTRVSDNHKRRVYSKKEAALRNSTPTIDLNQKERIPGANEAAQRSPAPVSDLNQKESTLRGKEAALQSRAPIFDLNQISREEEECQNNFEPFQFEEPKKGLIRGGSDEQHNDLKLSVCRNVGDGSNRVGKRKISWQDPVALRV